MQTKVEEKTSSVEMPQAEAERFLKYLENKEFFDLFDFVRDRQHVNNIRKLVKSGCLRGIRGGSIILHFNGGGDLMKFQKRQDENLTNL